jgi:hypothetical protein
MNARDKARAAKLRRVPDDAFAAEARRRGYRPAQGRYLIPKNDLIKIVEDLKLRILVDSEKGEVHQVSCLMHKLLRLMALNDVMPERFDRNEIDLPAERDAESEVRADSGTRSGSGSPKGGLPYDSPRTPGKAATRRPGAAVAAPSHPG